jgi:signal peptidase I
MDTALRKPATPRPSLHQRWFLREVVETILFVAIVYVLVELAAPRFLVEGPSMQPTFHDYQRLIISRINYLIGEPERGDIVVFNAPGSRAGDPPLIKRAIGLPGDTVEIRETQVYINGTLLDQPFINEPCEPSKCPNNTWALGPEEYFVMGDNRNHSRDSRIFGPIRRDNIIGEALIRYWPPEDWAFLEKIRFSSP